LQYPQKAIRVQTFITAMGGFVTHSCKLWHGRPFGPNDVLQRLIVFGITDMNMSAAPTKATTTSTTAGAAGEGRTTVVAVARRPPSVVVNAVVGGVVVVVIVVVIHGKNVKGGCRRGRGYRGNNK
jgi:hypothetical protein